MTRTRGARARRGFLAAGIGLAVLLTGACADDDGGESAAPTTTVHDDGHDHSAEAVDRRPKTEPCTLVPKASAEVALGPLAHAIEGAAETGTYGIVPDQRLCRYILQSDQKYGATLGFTDYDADRKFKTMEQNFAKEVQKVEGVGDKAIWIDTFRVLIAVDGKALVTVQLLDPSLETVGLKEKAVKLGDAAFDALAAQK